MWSGSWNPQKDFHTRKTLATATAAVSTSEFGSFDIAAPDSPAEQGQRADGQLPQARWLACFGEDGGIQHRFETRGHPLRRCRNPYRKVSDRASPRTGLA